MGFGRQINTCLVLVRGVLRHLLVIKNRFELFNILCFTTNKFNVKVIYTKFLIFSNLVFK